MDHWFERMTLSDVSAYIERLKRLLSVSTDQQLADEIGVAKQTIATWRKRGKIPLSVEETLSDRYGPEAAFSNFLRYATDRREDFIVCALYHAIRQHFGPKLPKAVGAAAEVRWGEALVHAEPALRKAIREVGFNYMDREEVFTLIASRITAGRFEDVIRGIDVYVRPYFHPELAPYTDDDAELNSLIAD